MKLWRITGDPSEEILHEVAALLNGGGIALLPTDTLYGLHGRASDPTVSARIAAIKGRAEEKPFVIIAANVDQLRALGLIVPEELTSLWPAPLTAILRRRNATPLAVRVPDRTWLRDLLLLTGPLVSTSANRSGEPPATSPSALPADLRAALDGVLDEGPREAKASAIVDFTEAEPRLVREGDRGFTQKLRKSLRKSL